MFLIGDVCLRIDISERITLVISLCFCSAISVYLSCICLQVTIVTFAVYVSTQPDHVLSPQVAFVSLSLFNILRAPLNLLPMMVSFVVMVSLRLKSNTVISLI